MEFLGQEYGDIFKLAFGPIPTIFISHPEAIQYLFTQPKEIGSPGQLNRSVAPLVGDNGLLLLEDKPHLQRRRLIKPAFHTDRIRTYGQQICHITHEVFSQQPKGEPFSAYPLLQGMALDMILQVIFSLNPGEDRYERMRHLLPQMMNYVRLPQVEICFSLPFLQHKFWRPWRNFLRLRRQFNQVIYDEIHYHRQNPNPKRATLLTELVTTQDETGAYLSDQEIRDLFPSLLLAGQDASSAGIAWCLYWVHRLPDIREKLKQELASLGRNFDPIAISELPYLTAVCQEALRLYPVQIVTFPRMVKSPISLMGYDLPQGTIIRGNIYLTHHRPDLYPEPKQFQPERFLGQQYNNYEFLPFGGGVRRCPGEILALFEMKLILAIVLSQYDLGLTESEPEYPKRRGVNFLPGNGLKMVINR
jgi:cytochrome P450